MTDKILMTGGSGLLGRYLKIEADRPSHAEIDVTKPFMGAGYELVIHCAAYTKVQEAEINRSECFDVNVKGTLNLLEAFPKTPVVYISSEYAGRPVNFYSWTKKWAEELVQLHPNYLIIRTLFKAYPFPFDHAFTDQFTMGDTVDIIAPLIDEEIKNWNRKGKKLVYVGTGRKTMFELAKKSRPDVLPNSIKDMKVPVPADYA